MNDRKNAFLKLKDAVESLRNRVILSRADDFTYDNQILDSVSNLRVSADMVRDAFAEFSAAERGVWSFTPPKEEGWYWARDLWAGVPGKPMPRYVNDCTVLNQFTEWYSIPLSVPTDSKEGEA
jgi:hypothetical protein